MENKENRSELEKRDINDFLTKLIRILRKKRRTWLQCSLLS